MEPSRSTEDDMMVYCADVGSVMSKKFGWASVQPADPHATEGSTSLDDLAAHLLEDLAANRKIALGFECPLWIPIREEPVDLTKGRAIDGGRAWSAAGGIGSLGVGLVEVVWLLRELRRKAPHSVQFFLDPEDFRASSSSILLWKAFVTGGAKHQGDGEVHVEDARIGARDFIDRWPDLSIEAPEEVYSLVGAALLRTGWSDDPRLLGTPCLVVRVQP